MSLTKGLYTSLAALASMVFLTFGAQAQSYAGGEARATTALNVRSGPGTGNAVVDVLQAGELVDVERCSSGWCYIEHSGPDGWVSARYLTAASGGVGRDGGVDVRFEGTARATTALNVRSGPGTQYRIIDSLYQGQRVAVEICRSGWCRISDDGTRGWVSARYLSGSGGGADVDIGFGISGPGFSFRIGTGSDFFVDPPRREQPGRVCFYEDFDYDGASFCARPGDRDPSLQSWNDRISSIRVIGNAEVQVCEHYNYQGRCAVLDQSRARLEGRNNDIISSYRVR